MTLLARSALRCPPRRGALRLPLLPSLLPSLLLALLLALLPSACGDPAAPPEPLTARSLPWIRVADGRLVDARGRQWHLRGMNARVEGIFDVVFDDGRQRLEPLPGFGPEDAAALAAAGVNLLRLPINWSGLEPEEGAIQEAYLARVDEVIAWCRDAGVYVLVDFHQDAYSKEIGEDGAPLWAILPAPRELLEGPLDDLDARRTSGPVLLAFESFFTNREGIQDRFLPAWEHVVRRYQGDAHVIGFELMNEPMSFLVDPSEGLLHEFYEKFATAMRRIDGRHTLWLEPDTTRNFAMESPLRSAPFPDDNVVYAPHLYPGLGSVDASTVEGWKAGLAETFSALQAEADSWGAAVAWGEWGTRPDGDGAEAYLQAMQELTLGGQVHEVFWVWKERSQGHWGFYDYDYDEGADAWSPRELAFSRYATPYAMAVPGRLDAQHYDRAAGELVVRFTAAGGEGAPLVYVGPARLAAGITLRVDGEAALFDADADTGRLLVAWAGAAGTHEVVVQF